MHRTKTSTPLPRRRTPIVLPPGPRGGTLGSALAMRRDPLSFCRMVAREYGDIAHYRVLMWPAYLLNHPDYVKHVLQEHHRNYSKDTGSFLVLRHIVGNGLLTSQGEFWLRQRRLAQPAFHHRQIASFGKLMTDAAGEMLHDWSSMAESGESFDLAQEMMHLTMRIAGSALFSTDMGGRAQAIGKAFATANKALTTFWYLPPPLLNWPAPWNRGVRSAISVVDTQVQDIIERRRASGVIRNDLLGMLLSARDADTGEGMTGHQVLDEVKTLLLAGYETTFTLLSWTWYLLSNHPAVEGRLQAEVDAVLGGRVPETNDLPNLPFTRMVVDEVLRLYPPLWLLSRKVEEDDEVGGFVLPANASVVLSPYVVHRHPAFWDEPDRFMPERFAPELARTRPQFAYFPFGGGPRLCIGNHFALMEAQLIIAMIVQRYRLRVEPGHPVEPEALITLRPRHGVRVVLERRAARSPAARESVSR